MYSRLTAVISQKNAGQRKDVLFYSCITGIICLSIFFRSQGYFDGNISFWWDEAHWANKLITSPLKYIIRIRPVGFMLLTKLLINISKDETVFRLVSYLSSILAIPLAFLIATRIWKSRMIILLMVFLISFNPILITFAKEFKPYALDFFIHTCFIYLVLRYIHSKNDYLLYAILAFSVFSIFFCYSIVFIFPAIFLILLFDAYVNRSYNKLALIIATNLILFIQLYLMYRFIWSGTSIAHTENYWGNKYDVFFLGSNLLEQFKWVVSKYAGLIEKSGIAGIFWPGASGLTPVIGLLLIIFHFVGILGFFLEKKFNLLLLFLFPIITVIFINSIGVWPFGPFRVNLFLFIYFLMLTVNGFNYLLNSNNRFLRYCVCFVIILFFFIIQLPVNLHHYNIKPRDTWAAQSDVRKALETIVEFEKRTNSNKPGYSRRIYVVAENHAYFSTEYYLSHHPNADEYNKVLRKLNMKYSQVSDGIGSDNIESIIGLLQEVSRNPKPAGRKVWMVIGKPSVIDKVEPIIDNIKDRIIYRKKLSYACLVLLLRN